MKDKASCSNSQSRTVQARLTVLYILYNFTPAPTTGFRALLILLVECPTFEASRFDYPGKRIL
jgi:hypothetical protein